MMMFARLGYDIFFEKKVNIYSAIQFDLQTAIESNFQMWFIKPFLTHSFLQMIQMDRIVSDFICISSDYDE